ncbi:MAG TPA: glycine--tRNA ligase subunit beta, partial [Bryobacteraceae bacterium]
MPDLLVEIGTEEIPDWMIEPALADWKTKFEATFGAFGGSAIDLDATPRRLVLFVRDLAAQAPDTENVVLGPYLSAGTKAAEGFARKWNTPLEQLQKTEDAKGERYVFHQLTEGQSVRAALEGKLAGVIASIQFPKTMSWPGSAGVRFIRPIRWIVSLLDDEVLDFEVAGVKAGNTTRGHRVLGAREPVRVTISTYASVLE